MRTKQKRALSPSRDDARLPMFGIIKRGLLHSAEGGNRTHIPKGYTILSRARLPVPPLRRGKASIVEPVLFVKVQTPGFPFSRMDEPALIHSAQKGDIDAFNRLVLAYQHQVYNLAYRIMGDEAAAADAAQEAFISAYNHLKSFRGGSFKSWLLRIVTNACYDDLRKRKRRPATSLEDMMGDENGEGEFELPSTADGPETIVQRREMATLLQQGITTLPDDQRIVLVLSDVQGMSYEEIAEVTNSNLGTVKSRLSRARGKLREYLQAHGELLPAQYRLQSDGT